MKTPDFDKERSENKLSVADFMKSYNESLPREFPCASATFLKEFRKTHPGLFKGDNVWSLEKHRKKFMDWLPQHTRTLS